MVRKGLVFILAVMLCFSLSIQSVGASAITPDIDLLWDNVNSITITLDDVGNGQLGLSVVLLGDAGATYDSISIGLFKMTKPNQGTVAQWTDLSSTSSYFSFYNTVTADASGSYRVIVRFNAVKNGVSEAVNAHLDKTF